MTSDARLRLVVETRKDETNDILCVSLVDAEGADLPPFEAGAHIDVDNGAGIIRQYSICNAPSERFRYRLGILKAPDSRGGSSSLHALLKPGTRLTVGYPRNAFRLSEASPSALLIGGGIGITPLISMAHQLHERGTPFALHYFAKTRRAAAFVEELTGSDFASSVHFHFDDESPGQAGTSGIFESPPSGDVYLCGPVGFMEWITQSALSAGYTSERIHSERFSGLPLTGGNTFTVTAMRSGITVEVNETETIAAALASAGVPLPLSCEQGICGTCLTRVVEGIPDHRDAYQTDAEKAANSHMTPCCSRALSETITLDI